jgi:pSer/pThr/pTyr-binding forkhead associated (FHA) protein
MNGKSVKKESVDPGATLNVGSVEMFVTGEAKPSVAPQPTGIDMPIRSSNNTVVRKPVVNSGFLTIEGKSGAGDIYRLQPGNNVVGRDGECDLSVSDPFISRKHAMISVNNGKALITDLGSRGGLKVNDRPVSSASVVPGTEISVGETKIQLLEIETPGGPEANNTPGVTLRYQGPGKSATAMVMSGPDAGKSFKLVEGANTIGRSSDCKIQLSDETVSRQHAQVLCSAGKLSVADLGSKTGTKVGSSVLSGTELVNGDTVTMGQTRFTLMGAAA